MLVTQKDGLEGMLIKLQDDTISRLILKKSDSEECDKEDCESK